MGASAAMKPERKAAICVLVLRYLADHMQAVLDIDPGPHEIGETDEEEAYIGRLVNNEANRIRARAFGLPKSRLRKP